ncbi:MAG: glycoside-pentoside-hexuronide (GPH):cation symporter [Eubacteriales bacterium]|nr:glycoside-pentoside-hexuronide (GPH):cation symporter [Eubacteriales bacterium]
MSKDQASSFETSRGERTTFGMFAFGAILSYYMIMSYLQLYMTNIGISAAAVGLIFIFAKVWDAVNDPIFGVIVDKVHFKSGKYRPWIRLTSIFIPITTILLFAIPSGFSVQIKILWSAVAYVLWDTAYTMYDVPMNAMVTAMTESQFERAKLYSLAAFFVYLGGIFVAIAVPMLFPAIGWGMTALLIGLLSFASMLALPVKAKERHIGNAEQEISVKQILLSLVHNKFLLIYTLAAIIGSVTNFALTLNGYFAIYCLGSASWITPLALATAVPVLFVALFVPKLFKRVEKFRAFVISRIITSFIDIAIFILGYANVTLLLVLIVVKNIFATVWIVSASMFIADCVEYGHFRTGERTQGIAFSTKAFTNKMIVALTGAIAMFCLSAYGFVSGEGAIQTQQTINGIWFLYAFMPIIGSVLSVAIMLLFYKLRDKDVQIMTRANNKEITREEAVSQLSRKFV